VHTVLCCAPVYHAGTLWSVSPHTHNAVRSHQHPAGCHAAPPGGVWQRQGSSNVFMPLMLCNAAPRMNVATQHAAMCYPIAVATHAVTTCTQLPSCWCSTAAMQCTSMQRELRTCSPEYTIAALEVSPNARMLCAGHGSLDEWHAFPGPLSASDNRCKVSKHEGVQKHHGFAEKG
jgi:hypothetical protein